MELRRATPESKWLLEMLRGGRCKSLDVKETARVGKILKILPPHRVDGVDLVSGETRRCAVLNELMSCRWGRPRRTM